MGTVTLLCILGGSLLISDCYGFSSRAQLHRQTRQAGVGPTRGSCPHLLKLFQGRATPEETEKDRIATQRIKTAQLLQKQGKSSAAIRLEISSCSPVTVTCDPSAKYRTADGSCNNLDNPEWGQAGTAQARLVNASYDDGISDPRSRSVAPGVTLPRVRRISNGVHAAGGRLRRSQTLTLQVFQMGQFLDHDIIATPVQSVVQDCCGTDGLIELTNQMVQTKELVLARLRHEVCNGGGAKGQCLELDIEHETARSMEVSLDQLNAVVSLANCNSIVIGAGDARFREGYCMPFRRSAPLFCAEESIQREQRNDVTSFIDASNVYGSSLAEQAALRDGALLRIEEGNRLPNNVDDEACLSDQNRGIFCSLAGDARVNVIPSLIAYHTLFVREHNRIASLLMQAYPNEETVFQETKKIITAEMQKIIYDEFLPSFLSDSAMEEYGLRNSATYSYDVNLNPTITNGFGIAFRVGHSWIPRTMEIFNRNLRRVQRINTENTFLRPDLTYRSGNPPPPGLEGLAYWLSGDPSPGTDRIIEDAARNRLFLDENGDALDLVSFNIQRGRDHGLPAYNTYREFCNLPSVPAEWSQLNGGNLVDHDSDSTRRLRDVYESPLDIDLFTGALTETPVDTGDVGRTLDCILGEQFRRLKYGDRFWYQSETAGFSAEQLEEINKVTMSRILCDNYNFGQIHRNAFLSTDLVDCSSIQHMNMTKFGASDIPPTQAPQPPPGGGSDGQRPPPGGGGGGGGQRPPAGGGGGGGGGGGQRPPPGAGGGGGQRPRPGRGEGRREGGGRG